MKSNSLDFFKPIWWSLSLMQIWSHHSYGSFIFIYNFMPFLHFDAHGFCMNILFYDFVTNSIEISWYWKFVMWLKDLVNKKKWGNNILLNVLIMYSLLLLRKYFHIFFDNLIKMYVSHHFTQHMKIINA
jgi:hypothetical protein